MIDLRYVRTRLAINAIVNTLNIDHCGSDSDHYFVQLANGLRFYGFIAPSKLKKYYLGLSRSVKRTLPFECYFIACDIAIRYVEGGLKFQGPKKERKYTAKPGDYISEMGAYRGYYTLYLREKIGPSGRIMAIEPNPENFALLKKNVDYNGFDNVDLVHGAIWDECTELNFQMRQGDGQSGSVDLSYADAINYKVDAYTLDELLQVNAWSHVDFMLIQLNGAELRALHGLDGIKPLHFSIAARYYEKESPMPDLIRDLLKSRGYEVEIVEEDYIYAAMQ